MNEPKVELKEDKKQEKDDGNKKETKEEKKYTLNANAKAFIPKSKPQNTQPVVQYQNINAVFQPNFNNNPSNFSNDQIHSIANPQITGMYPSQGMVGAQNYPIQGRPEFPLNPQYINAGMQMGIPQNPQNINSAYTNPQNLNINMLSTSQQINPYYLPNLYFHTYSSIIPPNIHDPNFDPYQYPEFVKTYKSEFKRIFLGNDPYSPIYRGIFHHLFGPIPDLINECYQEENLEDPLADYNDEDDDEYDRKKKKKEKKKKDKKDQDDSEPAIKKEKKPKVIKEKPKKVVRLDDDDDKIDLSKLKLDEVDETRKPISACLFGHVGKFYLDCGKSTTCGSIMVCANKVDMR